VNSRDRPNEKAKMMIKSLTRCTLVALVLFSSAAAAEPIKLKLAFPTSDRAELYLYAIKPFVDSVNTEANGLIEIEVYFSGVLGGSRPTQRQLVLDGVADMALIASGQWPLQFPDDTVLELPGLFHDAREATLSYTGLIYANALRGYEVFFVIGAFSNGPGNIHSRKHLSSLSDLKGMKIGATSTIEAAVLERLGAVSNVLPIPQTMDALSDGSIDGTAVAPAVFAAFGIGRVTTYHYLLPISGAPLALVMNRKKFDGLPEQAQSVIRKYSGEWMATGFVAHWQVLEKGELERIKSNARRTITFPSPMDIEAAQAVFQSVNDEWAVKSPRNLELLTIVEKELAKIRSTP
jgi:TRAP-type C4-dicarboxylate transport system substrate-binding protein